MARKKSVPFFGLYYLWGRAWMTVGTDRCSHGGTMSGYRPRKKLLILCTGNTCRSQMAEGLVNHLLGDAWTAFSAGTDPGEQVHPLAIEVMKELGIDISGGTPEPIERYLDRNWDLVITVCDSAKETCPVFPGRVEQIHVGFPDPAEATGSREERLAVFRKVRDAIASRLLPEVERRT